MVQNIKIKELNDLRDEILSLVNDGKRFVLGCPIFGPRKTLMMSNLKELETYIRNWNISSTEDETSLNETERSFKVFKDFLQALVS